MLFTFFALFNATQLRLWLTQVQPAAAALG
jgi:hypothetical protein